VPLPTFAYSRNFPYMSSYSSDIVTDRKILVQNRDFYLLHNPGALGKTAANMFQLFLPRDAMQARFMLSCSVRPSVCPSVTFVDHVKTNKHIFEIFFHHRVATPF